MSLITFRSPTQGSVVMFGENAQQLLSALNLPAAGEILTAELPAMIERLQSAIETDKRRNPAVWPDASDPDFDRNAPIVVHFSQRATPMLLLMERCLAATETIRWPA